MDNKDQYNQYNQHDIDTDIQNILKLDKNEFADECPNYMYNPPILPPVKRIIVIGDLHGDYKVTIDSLKKAKVIDDDLNWIGEDTYVVQVGDQIDRCRSFYDKNQVFYCSDPKTTINDEASDIKIINLFTKLNNEATKSNGAVISLLGNHEILNVKGNLNWVSYLGLREFDNYKDPINPTIKFEKGEDGRKYAFAPGNELGKFLACTRLSSVIIGSFLFMHGGIASESLDKIGLKSKHDLIKFNNKVRKWLLNKIDKDYINQIVLSGEYSIFWNRILSKLPPNLNNNDPRCRKHLDGVLDVFKIGHVVVGHTPQYFTNHNGINGTCDNKILRVDQGSSMAFSHYDTIYQETNGSKIADMRNIQVLEILNDKQINII